MEATYGEYMFHAMYGVVIRFLEAEYRRLRSGV
jgi:hypothetical protein